VRGLPIAFLVFLRFFLAADLVFSKKELDLQIKLCFFCFKTRKNGDNTRAGEKKNSAF